ncbi:hypothetical protein D3C80_1959520 [compost metagenome]
MLKVSGGDLPQAINPTATFEDPMLIKFNWETNHITYEHTSDQAMVVVYDIESKIAITRIFDGAFRRYGTLTVKIPHDFKGREVHAYIGFVSDDREIQSDSQYLGKIEIPA